jgi:hypothetical protein
MDCKQLTQTFSQQWNKKHGPEVHGLPVGKIFPVPQAHFVCMDSTSSLPLSWMDGLSHYLQPIYFTLA